MKIPKPKVYFDFDDFVRKNHIEVISYSHGVVARWSWVQRYKKGGYRVVKSMVSQSKGVDYKDLTIKLKREQLKLFHFPWLLIFGIMIGWLFIQVGIESGPSFFIILGILIGPPSFFYSIIRAIEFFRARKILKSKSLITRDCSRKDFYDL